MKKIDIEKIKDESAKSRGYSNWKNLLTSYMHSYLAADDLEAIENKFSEEYSKVAQEYAKQCCEEDNKIMKDAIKIAISYFESCRDHWEEGESINP